jgi:hypothetical protein
LEESLKGFRISPEHANERGRGLQTIALVRRLFRPSVDAAIKKRQTIKWSKIDPISENC